MITLGVIEESLTDTALLAALLPYRHAQRTEDIPGDECPVWHINEYRMDDAELLPFLDALSAALKQGWYAHAFTQETLYVMLRGKWFTLSPAPDADWDEMIAYGTEQAGVERRFLENIPLRV